MRMTSMAAWPARRGNAALRLTEPQHIGRTWQQPGRGHTAQRAPLWRRFAACPVASLAVALVLVAACIAVAFAIPLGPAA